MPCGGRLFISYWNNLSVGEKSPMWEIRFSGVAPECRGGTQRDRGVERKRYEQEFLLLSDKTNSLSCNSWQLIAAWKTTLQSLSPLPDLVLALVLCVILYVEAVAHVLPNKPILHTSSPIPSNVPVLGLYVCWWVCVHVHVCLECGCKQCAQHSCHT